MDIKSQLTAKHRWNLYVQGPTDCSARFVGTVPGDCDDAEAREYLNREISRAVANWRRRRDESSTHPEGSPLNHAYFAALTDAAIDRIVRGSSDMQFVAEI